MPGAAATHRRHCPPNPRLRSPGFVSGEYGARQPRAQSVIGVIYLRRTRRQPMRFDLADLSLFRHVVEAGSITAGAARANLALSAASTRIRNMEDAPSAALLV